MGKMIKGEKNIYYWTSAFCINDDEIWFIYGKLCLLCKYTISTKVNKIIGVVPVDDPMKENLFQKVILAENKLFLIPCWANDIVIYDLIEDKFYKIKIKAYSGLKFSGAYLYRKKIICVPASYEFIVGIDIDELSVTYEYDMKLIKEQYHIEYFNISDLFENNKVIMCSPQSDKIYIYDMEHQMLQIDGVRTETDRFEFVVCIGEIVILCEQRKREIITYNYKTKKIQKVFWPIGKKRVAVSRLGNKIIVDDFNSAWVGIYNTQFKLLEESFANMISDRKYYYSYLIGICEEDDDQYIYFNNSNMSFNWVNNGRFEEKVQLVMREEDRRYIKQKLFIPSKLDETTKENYFFTLNDFLMLFCKNGLIGD